MKKEITKKETLKKEEDWMQKKWRPMMALMYMCVCAFDFIIFPIMFTIVQFWETQSANDAFRQWQPITLLGGGLFHLAMGAVLGVSAWSRGQEKIAGVATPNQMIPVQSTPVLYNQPQQMNTNFNNGMYSQQSYQPSYATESTYTSMTPITTGYKGKKAPMQPDDPII
jgi:hypothetical protein